MKKTKAPAAWIKDGARAVFELVRGHPDYTYRGVVEGEPWQLGSGDWVVRLRDLTPPYRSGRSTEPSACVDHLRPLRPR